MVTKTIAAEVTDHAVRSAMRAIKDEMGGRDDNGWRAGKPVEDPEKMKRWGFVTAKPSEYLVHMRKGKIIPRTSGQGASCFKWPWDSVAVIPTTIQRIYFSADQVTAEKVGVQVKGLSVYRVARPELTVRMLNFSFPERAQEKLAETLRDMFVGAVRRLVANLKVEECLARRKESLAAFLLAEIAPVVSGAGRASDSTDRGWGVVIDTIEIQEVQVLSEQVFAHMQAPYRNQLMLKAREAELAREQELEETQARAAGQMRELKAQSETRAAQIEAAETLKRIAAQVDTDRARVEAEKEMEKRRLEKDAEVSRSKAEKEREGALLRAKFDSEARRHKAESNAVAVEAEAMASERQRELVAAAEQAMLQREREKALLKIANETEISREQAKAESEAAASSDAIAAEHAARSQELAKNEAASKAEVKHLEMELTRVEGELKAMLMARQREVENTISVEKLQSDFVNRALPELAKVFSQQFGKVEIITGANENPFGFLVHAFEGFMDLAHQGGLSQAVTNVAGALKQPPSPQVVPPSTNGNGHGAHK